MLEGIRGLWRGPHLVEFESSYGLSESVERLRAATLSSVFSAMSQQAAVGTVKASRVSLQRVIPMVGNSFKPFYRGRFIERDGKVILTGQFTMHWFAKGFLVLWFGGIVCGVLFGEAAAQPQNMASVALAGIGMIIAGAALVRLGKWFARNDEAWLSDVIRKALHAQSQLHSNSAMVSGLPALQSTERPTVILVTAGVLLLMGVMSLVSIIIGIQPVHANSNSLVIGRFDAKVLRYLFAGNGVATLALAFGVYRRRLLAWRAGIVFLIVAWLSTVAQVLATDGLRNGVGIGFCIVSAFVAAYWIRWWHAQRLYFQE